VLPHVAGDVLYLDFNEADAGVRPSDQVGRYEDLAPGGAAESAPVPTRDPDRALTGLAALFGASSAQRTEALATAVPWADRTGGIAAALWWDYDAQAAAGEGACLITFGGGAEATVTIALELEPLDLVLRTARMWLRWTKADGTAVAAPAATFRVPEEPFTIYASREYTTAGLVVRYAAAGLDLGEVLLADVDVATDTLVVHVGGRPGPAAPYPYDRHFRGLLDLLHVVPRAIVSEESRASADRFARIAPALYRAIRMLDQPGIHAQGRETLVQRELQVEAAAWSIVRELAEQLRTGHYPARAWGQKLAEWEQALHLPAPSELGIDARRARLLRRFSDRYVSAPADVQARLAELLDLPAADVALLEPDNAIADTFTPATTGAGPTLYVTNHNARSWIAIDEGVGTVTEPAGGNDYLAIALPASAHDARYKGAALAADHVQYLRCIGDGQRLRVDFQIRTATVPSGHIAGAVFGSRTWDRWLWIGVVDVGAGDRLAAVEYVPEPDAGVSDTEHGRITLTSEILDLGAAPAAPYWIRIEQGHTAAGAFDASAWRLRTAASSGALDAATPVDVVLNPLSRPPHYATPAWVYDWTGFGFTALGDVLTSSSALVLQVSDWSCWPPRSEARFTWAAYRDPLLPGTPDLRGAQLEVQRFAPLHTRGTVIDHQHGLYTNDGATLLDRDRLGT
jgi:hypothetical protein